MLALARSTGKIKWMTQLPRFKDPKDKKGPISWVGPILAGDRLIVASSDGQISNVSPIDGAVQSTVVDQGADRAFAGGRQQHALCPR